MPIRLLIQHLAAGLALALAATVHAAPALPALGVDLAQTTVSGVSSGAYMAEQFGVAYSGTVAGVALIAGGPYFCAGEPDSTPPLWNAFSRCMNPAAAALDPPDAVLLWARTQQFAAQGQIDDVANLRHQRVFLFSGVNDELVTSAVMDQTRNFYDFAHAAQVTFIDTVPSGHGMITARSSDSACDANLPPYFNNCQRPLARELLAALYDGLAAPAQGRLAGTMVRFNQRAFAPAGSGLAPEAFMFMPTACRNGGCRVHVAFHGCFQSVRTVQDHFYRHAGYNETAAANRIVVLYPQVEPTNFPYNPLACWDYWGYSGPGWYTRTGVQVAAVHAMLMRLAQPRNRIAVRK